MRAVLQPPAITPPRFRHQSGLGDPCRSPYRALLIDTPALRSIPCDPVDHPTSPFYIPSTFSLLRRDSLSLSPHHCISISMARVVSRELSRSLSQTRTVIAAVTLLLVLCVLSFVRDAPKILFPYPAPINPHTLLLPHKQSLDAKTRGAPDNTTGDKPFHSPGSQQRPVHFGGFLGSYLPEVVPTASRCTW